MHFQILNLLRIVLDHGTYTVQVTDLKNYVEHQLDQADKHEQSYCKSEITLTVLSFVIEEWA